MIADRFGTWWCQNEEPHVEVQVGVLLRRVDPMDVHIDRRRDDAQPFDAGFLGGLAKGDVGQVGVAVGVSTRL